MTRARLVTFAKSDDPNFNHKAAQAAYDLVMKMDLDEAKLFTSMVVADTCHDIIEKNQRSFQRRLNTIAKRQLESFAKGLHSTVISKRMADEAFDEEEALATAGALALITKAVKAPPGFFEEHEHRRSANGRFTFKVKQQTLAKPLGNAHAQAAGIDGETQKKRIKGLTDKQKAEYQSQYLQIASVLDAFDNNDHGWLMIQPLDGSEAYKMPIRANKTTTLDRGNFWDPKTERVASVQIEPSKLTLGGASFDLMQALSANPEGKQATHLMRARQIEAAADNADAFEREWLGRNDDDVRNSTNRSYRQIAAGSKYLDSVLPETSKYRIATQFGSLVGERGPQAERVIGPFARRTAYRYRGVSKEPDAKLAREYALTRDQNLDSDGNPRMTDELGRKIKIAQEKALTTLRDKGEKIDLARESRIRAVARQKVLENTPRNSEQQLSNLRRTLAAEIIESQGEKNPKSRLYNLQLSSGHTPPSEGVIIDAKGNLVTQAVGYADDHYLPFNLKELGKLKGGEYVRTRSVGGPTAEDIYTGFVAGAHAMTVHSRSGTFEVVFEDDFKGGRRYNDKAKRMVDRYERLIDAVESREVRREYEIDPQVRAAIADDVQTQYPEYTNQDLVRGMVQDRLRAMATSEDLSEDDERVVDILQTRAEKAGDSPQMAEAVARSAVLRAKRTNYRLDSQGYKAALDSLAEQFPYYIKRVVYTPPSQANEGLALDRGYVKPKHNRPAEALAGYYDPTIAGAAKGIGEQATGKFSADQADWQNSGVRNPSIVHRSRHQEFEAAEQKAKLKAADKAARREAGETGEKTLVATPVEPEAQTNGKKVKQRGALADAAKALYEKILPNLDKDAKANWEQDFGTPDALAKAIGKSGLESGAGEAFAAKMEQRKDLFERGGHFDNDTEAKGLYQAFRLAKGELESVPWSGKPDQLFTASEYPFTFAEYDHIDSPAALNAAMAKVDALSVGDDVTYKEMEDADLVDEIKSLARLKQGLSATKGQGVKATDEYLTNEGLVTTSRSTQDAMANPAYVNHLAEAAQRMRALKAIEPKTAARAPRSHSTTTKVPQEDEESVRVPVVVPPDLAAAVDQAFKPESKRTEALKNAALRARARGDGARAAQFNNAALVSAKEETGVMLGEWETKALNVAQRDLGLQ